VIALIDETGVVNSVAWTRMGFQTLAARQIDGRLSATLVGVAATDSSAGGSGPHAASSRARRKQQSSSKYE
jgi:hypothetical protein